MLGPQSVLVRLHQFPDFFDFVQGLAGSFFDATKHVKYPRFPCSIFANGLQPAIIMRSGPDDVTAEIKNGQIEQTVLDEIKQIQNAAGSSIAVVKRMNALELIVENGHSHQRIDFIALDAIEVIEKVGDQLLNFRGILRRFINDLAGRAFLSFVPGSLRRPESFPTMAE